MTLQDRDAPGAGRAGRIPAQPRAAGRRLGSHGPGAQILARRIRGGVPGELSVVPDFAAAFAVAGGGPAAGAPAAGVPAAGSPAAGSAVSGSAVADVPAAGIRTGSAHPAAGPRTAPVDMAWLALVHPDPETIAELASAWELHPLLVEDLLHAGQRPKVERYGDVLFLVLKSAHYDDAREDVEFSEFHVLVRPDAIAIVCQDGRFIDGTPIPDRIDGSAERAITGRAPQLTDRALLELGPEAAAYRLLDAVVDRCFPALDGLQIDREQIERQVFSGDAAAAARIYHLSQEVIDMLHTSAALTRVANRLGRGADKYAIPEELQTYLQDVADHLARVSSETVELRDALSQILTVNATLVAQRQNEDMKKISGWAAILFAPTLIAAVYGMNFDIMPELHWAAGYPIAVGAMIGFAGLLYGLFRWKKWM
ncbi:magnesium and cobalt transport protein CorA [Leucobacter allii]|uniref:Magnesium and cobalt transport protein CorA n=1 Tax=Leucobacter allii TaxID=2932247 RepID=A0ABY4FMV7_9MICO|nr:magnesium and cobalt transport protein CorA [Leucobacter allii]UOQ57620.1 magnesium and cobalt transport protein CorA [Leucobacter allii]